MCGRFALTASPEELSAIFGLLELEPFPPRYNIAPTQPILLVTAAWPGPPGSNRPARRAMLARWGFIPGWAKDPAELPLMINARAESALDKASFRVALRHRRVLVPASGFYEWRRDGGKRSQPYWVRPLQGGLIAFGGLLETYADPGGSEIDTAAILTTAASSDIAHLHGRMPLIISEQDFPRWLDCRSIEPRHVAGLMRPASPGLLEAIPVSEKVNKVVNTGADLQERANPPLSRRPPVRPDQPELF